MDAVAQGEGAATGGIGGGGNRELTDEVAKVEAELTRRLPIGWSTSLGESLSLSSSAPCSRTFASSTRHLNAVAPKACRIC